MQKLLNGVLQQNNAYAQQQQKVETLKAKLAELANTQVKTAAFTSIESEIEKCQTSIDNLIAKQERFVEIGGNTESNTFKGMEYDLQKLFDRMTELEAKRDEMQNPGSGYQGAIDNVNEKINSIINAQEKLMNSGGSADSPAMKKYDEMLQEAYTKLEALEEKQRELQSQNLGSAYQTADTTATEGQLETEEGKLEQMGTKLETKFSELTGKAAEFGESAKGASGKLNALASAGSALCSVLKRVGSVVLSAAGHVKDFAVSLTSKAASGLRSVASAGAKAASKLLGFNRATESSNFSMKKALTMVIKYAFGIRSLYIAWRKIRSAIVDGFNNVAQASEETKTKLADFKSSVSALKNAAGAAVAPLANALLPVLTSIVDKCTAAANSIASFFAALTGAKTYVKSVKSAASATEDASKANKDYLSGLDEVKKFTDDSSGSGFESAEVENGISGLAQKIKDAWANADFTEIGAELTSKLADALDKIPWEKIQALVNKVAKSVGTLINGIFGNPDDWNRIGTAVGKAISTIIGFLKTLFDTIDFSQIGTSLASAANGIVNAIPWSDLGDVVANLLTWRMQIIAAFAEAFDWSTLGASIATGFNSFVTTITAIITSINWTGIAVNMVNGLNSLISNIDWVALGNLISTSFITALNFIKTSIETMDWKSLGENIKVMFESIDWAGVAESLFGLLGAALGGLCAFLEGLLGDAITSLTTWWNETAFDEYGNFTMSGLYNGIKEALASIKTWVYDNIWVPFRDAFCNAFGIASPSTKMYTLGQYIVQGLLNGISNIWNSVATFFTNAWNRISSTITTAWNTIKSNVNGAINSLKTTISGGWDSIRSAAVTKWDSIRSGIVGKFGEIKTNLSGRMEDIKTTLWNGFENVRCNMINAFVNAYNSITQSSWWSVGSYVVQGIVSGMSSIGSSIGSWASGFLTNVKNALGIASPSKLFRDEVGYYLGLGIADGFDKSSTNLLNTVSNLAGEVSETFADEIGGMSFNIPVGASTSGINLPSPYIASGLVPPMTSLSATESADLNDALQNIASVLKSMNSSCGGSSYNVSANINGRNILDIIIDEAKLMRTQSGQNPLALGGF